MTPLNAGRGLCQPTHQLSIRPVQAVLELGAVRDVIHTALNAAHHANRHGDPGQWIAVGLPGLHVRRGAAHPGHKVVLFGSEAALNAYQKLEGVQTLMRRVMVRPLELTEAYASVGEIGTAYVRDRAAARLSPGAVRRAQERAARRGIVLSDKFRPRPPSATILALNFGSAVVHVRSIEAKIGTEPLYISTYGFSSPEAPAVLPIQADRSIRQHDDAA